MGAASFAQTSFLSGEWAPQFQGRFDRDDYRQGMNLCLNVIPIEEGSATRRPGTRVGGPTRKGNFGVTLEFAFDEAQPFNIELTAGYMRLWAGSGIVTSGAGQQITGATTDNPIHLNTPGNPTTALQASFATNVMTVVSLTGALAIGDYVFGAGLPTGTRILSFMTGTGGTGTYGLSTTPGTIAQEACTTQFAWIIPGTHLLIEAPTTADVSQITPLLGRQLEIASVDNTGFTVTDALTGLGIDGSTVNMTYPLAAYVILEVVTPYLQSELQQVRIVQDGVSCLLLHHNHPPQQLSINVSPSGAFSSYTFGPATLYDGPYLDIPSDGSTLTPGATSGSIAFTASAITSVNNGAGFVASDIGRFFRIFSEPLLWASGTHYASGTLVKYADVYWAAVASNINVEPDTDNGTNWIISTTAAAWTWGTITAINSPSSFQGTPILPVAYPENIAGGSLLYTNAAVAWQLGAYCPTVGYPATGAYYEGRVWLGGAIKNRFDASVTNDFGKNGYINFAPTGRDGTVADNNGVSGTLNAKEIENFLWMLPDEQGVLAGTQSGEWIIASSSSQEPITATSIQTREITHYGSAAVAAIKVGRASVLVHRDERKIYEYMANYFTQKFVAENLSLKAKHLSSTGIAQLAFQRELSPIIWARRNDGRLIGCSYKHDDPIKPMEFAGWHQHQLGHGREVISVQAGPAQGGGVDTLAMVTQDTVTGYCFVEFMNSLWDVDDTLLTAQYLDGATPPVGVKLVTIGGVEYLVIYGLWYLNGYMITAWLGGLDCGDYTVANGEISIPVNSTLLPLLTTAYLAQISSPSYTFSSYIFYQAAGAAPLPAPVNAVSPYVHSITSVLAEGSGTVAVPDWNNNNLFLFGVYGGSLTGIGVYDAFGLHEKYEATAASLGASWTVVPPACVDAQGFFYCQQNGVTNPTIIRLSPSLAFEEGFGTATIDGTSDATHLAPFSAIAAINAGASTYIVTVSYASSANLNATGVVLLAAKPFSYLTQFVPAEVTVALCTGPTFVYPKSTVGYAYGLGMPSYVSGATSSTMSLYAIFGGSDGGVGSETIVSGFSPGYLYPTWTTISNMNGPALDQTDNNLLIVATAGNVAETRLIKLNAVTGAVMWTCLLPSSILSSYTPVSQVTTLGQWYISNGVFGYIYANSGEFLQTINTITGAIIGTTPITTPGYSLGGGQAYNSAYGMAIGFAIATGYSGGKWGTFGNVPAPSPIEAFTIPANFGFTFTSQGQILRPATPQESQTQTGPSQGKFRRMTYAAPLLYATQGMSMGVDFLKMRSLALKSPGGTVPLTVQQAYSGVYWGAVDATSNYDNMWCWQVSRPYPCTVVAVECQIKTDENT